MANVKITGTPKAYRLSDISIGDMFVWLDEVFLRISPNGVRVVKNHPFVAVALEDGVIEHFEGNTKVEPVAEVVLTSENV